MLREANGQDPYLVDEAGQPDACGLTFDDVARSVVHPHVYIPTREEKEALFEALSGVYLEPSACP